MSSSRRRKRGPHQFVVTAFMRSEVRSDTASRKLQNPLKRVTTS